MNNNKNEYLTKDLGEAAAIFSQDVKIIRLERDPSGFYWFVFPSEKSNELANQYWTNDLQVSAKSYYDAMRTLKDRLFSRR